MSAVQIAPYVFYGFIVLVALAIILMSLGLSHMKSLETQSARVQRWIQALLVLVSLAIILMIWLPVFTHAH